MTTSEILKLVLDGMSAGAAGMVAIVAWRGVSTWRAQLGGTAEHDTARMVLLAVYRLEHLIDSTRNVFSSTAEAADRQRSPDETPQESTARDTAYAYRARLARVIEARNQLRLAQLEALSLWGRVAAEVLEPFHGLTNQLGHTQSDFFSDTEQGARRRNQIPAQHMLGG